MSGCKRIKAGKTGVRWYLCHQKSTEDRSLCGSALEKVAAMSFRDAGLAEDRGKAPQMSLP